MALEDLKNIIKPELELIFGATMTNLILNRAKMKILSESKNLDDPSMCRMFIEHLSDDDRLVGMWGKQEVGQRASRWKKQVGEYGT